jgi:hypothetical protein
MPASSRPGVSFSRCRKNTCLFLDTTAENLPRFPSPTKDIFPLIALPESAAFLPSREITNYTPLQFHFGRTSIEPGGAPMPNRDERRQPQVAVSLKTITPAMAANYMAGRLGCCWNGCDKSFVGKDGTPKGWRNILRFWTRRPSLNLGDVQAGDWSRDGVLCPEHVEAMQRSLKPLTMDVVDRPRRASVERDRDDHHELMAMRTIMASPPRSPTISNSSAAVCQCGKRCSCSGSEAT